MEGCILSIDAQQGKALIKAENGQRYLLELSEWRGAAKPMVSAIVDFDLEVDTQTVKNVYPLQSVVASNKSKATTTLLSLSLGAFGAHKFYLGAWGWGLLYLIFSWTFVPAILNVVELVRYIVLTDDEFAAKLQVQRGAFSFLW